MSFHYAESPSSSDSVKVKRPLSFAREGPKAKDYAAPVTPVLGSGSEGSFTPVQQEFRHKALSSLPFLLSFTVAHPCVSRCRSSTWLISKVGCTPKPNTHSRGLFTLLTPWKEEFCWSGRTEGVVQGFLREADETLLNDFANIMPSLRSTFSAAGSGLPRGCLSARIRSGLCSLTAVPFLWRPQNPPGQPALSPVVFRKRR